MEEGIDRSHGKLPRIVDNLERLKDMRWHAPILYVSVIHTQSADARSIVSWSQKRLYLSVVLFPVGVLVGVVW